MIGVVMSAADRKPSPNLSPHVARLPGGRLDLWVCTRCGYTYDGNAGEPISHTAPGTPFEVLPDDWRCPHCTAEKDYFFH